MNLVPDIESLNKILKDYFVKNTFTNNYLLSDAYHHFIAEKKIYCILTNSNACIIHKKDGFLQIYYYVNNFSELFTFPNEKPLVMEILYRGESQKPHLILEYWKSCGFKQHLIRDTMILSYSNAILPHGIDEKITIKFAESDEEIVYTQKTIEGTFDKYTGDILSFDEVSLLVNKHNVVCAYYDNVLCGILQFEHRNNQVYLGHIAVSSEFRGKGIANALVRSYIVDNASHPNTKYNLWVIQDNSAAVSLYQKFGFVYGNKSSVSLLKE